jgi:hypothetical protein
VPENHDKSSNCKTSPWTITILQYHSINPTFIALRLEQEFLATLAGLFASRTSPNAEFQLLQFPHPSKYPSIPTVQMNFPFISQCIEFERSILATPEIRAGKESVSRDNSPDLGDNPGWPYGDAGG